ncbi:prevent-host-death protein [Streptomyces sp. S1A]|uniref:Prevent-host-death protein n=1 Tax=Streptomyces chitinivorans TaxID=1257027 RepID=A0ABW7HTD6_9ACTN|nr:MULTISPECIES: prevent-host-death protein [Streptomyces]MCG3041804.1 prevent-host-death protein [Streptomyces sp. ICN903]MDH2407264.1 prevent-host-death protein [Streptomyces chitinivorans]
MNEQPEITEPESPAGSMEFMDAAQAGQPFAVTRDGQGTGGPAPWRQRRRFVTRAEFAATSRTAPDICLDAFRADQDHTAEQGWRLRGGGRESAAPHHRPG